jgi:hypothetical protein
LESIDIFENKRRIKVGGDIRVIEPRIPKKFSQKFGGYQKPL